MPKSWVELRVEIDSSRGEEVSNFLIEHGSPGVVQEEVSRGSHPRDRYIAYFQPNPAFGETRRKIRAYLRSLCRLDHASFELIGRRFSQIPADKGFGLIAPPPSPPQTEAGASGKDKKRNSCTFQLKWRIIPEEKWAENWKRNFRPLRITPRLVIKPPWEPFHSKKNELVIEIDPGMAFGTGTHASTQMCLESLEKLIPVYGRPTVLDVGTGSGILAIAARRWGADRILAIDIDPEAIANAEKNAAANGIGGQVDFRLASLNGLRRVFDIVVANLLPQELLAVAPSLSRRMASEGSLIISGFLGSQKREMASVFAGHGLNVRGARESKGWVCLVLKREHR